MAIHLYEKPLKIELEGKTIRCEGREIAPQARTLSEMREVLASRYVDVYENTELYYMYRDVYTKNEIRFDITVIPPNKFSGEYAKTYGHYHGMYNLELDYPEVYQVLKGKALFMLQRRNRDGSVSVLAVSAHQGDVVLMPPNYGHVSINVGTDTLVLSNLVYSGFKSLYEEYKINRGAAYYYTEEGLVHNTSYMVKAIRQITAKELNKLYFYESGDILQEFHANPAKFEFLKNPRLLGKYLQ